MDGLRTVLVGIDFSDSAHRALEVGIALAARLAATLELVHVWNRGYLVGELGQELDPWIGDRPAALTDQLEQWRLEAQAAGVRATSRLLIGVASRAIPELTRSMSRSLIVLGRRGSANLSHVLLGSVSERIAHASSCPVLVVPEKSPARTCPERIMVGVDFSDASKDAYLATEGLADQLQMLGGLILAHVRPGPRELYLANWSEVAYRGEHESSISRWAGRDGGSRIRRRELVLEGRPEQQLIAAAAREDCDWLAVGTQGRGALSALIMGSTTHRLLKLTDRPVLVLPVGTSPVGELTS